MKRIVLSINSPKQTANLGCVAVGETDELEPATDINRGQFSIDRERVNCINLPKSVYHHVAHNLFE